MINKNVANYTDFQGRTNKKIVQAPGGASSISLGWGNNDNSYKQEHKYGRKIVRQQLQPQIYSADLNNSNKNTKNTNNYDNMRVMNTNQQNYEKYENSMPNHERQYDKSNQYQNNSIKNSAKALIGGEYGYNNYTPSSNKGLGSYNIINNNLIQDRDSEKNSQTLSTRNPVTPLSIYKPSSIISGNYEQVNNKKQTKLQQYDNALYRQKSKIQNKKSNTATSAVRKQNHNQSHNMNVSGNDNFNKNKVNQGGYKNQTLPSSYNNQSNTDSPIKGRSCIKINNQHKTNIMFGEQYNYWKQDGHGEDNRNNKNIKEKTMFNNNNNQNARIQPNQRYEMKNNIFPTNDLNNGKKPEVKIHVPPGGKSNFIFG